MLFLLFEEKWAGRDSNPTQLEMSHEESNASPANLLVPERPASAREILCDDWTQSFG